ncbi:uncharacterized protein [Procambarus clarkii]|uniref:uncharacterized protein n=1 Tax=Procambarus clarkii TaxID=6728 RepID=UPI003743A621
MRHKSTIVSKLVNHLLTAGRTGEEDEGCRDSNPTPDTAGDAGETVGNGRSGKTAADEPGDETGGTEPPERAVFCNTTTRSPRSPAGGTTPPPHAEPEPSDADDAPEASSTGTSLEETSTQAAAGTWTSATTDECDATGISPPSLEDPPSSNSPASSQSEDRRERLGAGRTSTEPDVDPETRSTQAGRTDALRRTAASSTTQGTRSSSVGGPTATPAQLGTRRGCMQ